VKVITAKNEGFTLVEALLVLVILMIAATGLILPFASSVTVQAQGCNQTIATKLACDLIEQIIADPNGFDQIKHDYDGYAELKGQVKDVNGVVFTDPMYADFSRQVADCNYIYMPPQTSFGTANFIRITVRVYDKGIKIAEITRLKSR
jgi:Tfp pilus assembly major pilin PilA